MEPLKIDDLFEIFPFQSLPNFSTPYAQACVAKHKGEPGESYFALLCPLSHSIPRLSYLEKIVSLSQQEDLARHLLIPIAYKFVSLEDDRVPSSESSFESSSGGYSLEPRSDLPSGIALVLIFKDPKASRLDSMRFDVWPEQAVFESILPAAITVLSALEKEGLTHRAIRIDNLFVNFDEEKPRVIFGDFISSLPGMYQPAYSEPVSSAFSVPLARGDQSIKTDLYALGVMILSLVVGREDHGNVEDFYSMDPLSETLAHRKIRFGSFEALQGGRVVLNRLSDLLRGLLCDDEAERFGIEELRTCLKRRKVRVPCLEWNRNSARITDKPLYFLGQEIFSLRSFALSLQAHPLESCVFLKEKIIPYWIETAFALPSVSGEIQALVDDFLQEGIADSILEGGEITVGSVRAIDRFLTKIAKLVDLESPVLASGLPMTPEGLKDALLAFYILEQPASACEALLESFHHHFPELLEKDQEWLKTVSAGHLKTEWSRILLMSFCCRLFPNLPCLSPLYARDVIENPRSLVEALECRAERLFQEGYDSLPEDLVDEHVLAFLLARESSLKDVCYSFVVAPSVEERFLCFLDLMEHVQSKVYKEPLPHLSKLLTFSCVPLIERYKNWNRRNTLSRQFQMLVSKGDLSRMRYLLDSQEHLEKDRVEFRLAKMALLLIDSEINLIEKRLQYTRTPRTRRRAMSATLSFLCTLLTSSYLFLKFWPS